MDVNTSGSTDMRHSVIAFTGLGGHAFSSWRSRISTECLSDRLMWLRDFLPREFPNARIMTYGYNSSLKESNGANMTNYRRGFVQCLRNCRRQCPVICCLMKLLSNMLTISLCYIETPHCLYRAQFGRHPGCSGRRSFPKFNSYSKAALQAADHEVDITRILTTTVRP